jgi:sacsin
MPQSFRERVDTASSIKSILDCYPLGNGLLRELLQNSDDAGATSQVRFPLICLTLGADRNSTKTFILDSRQYGVDTLLDPSLKETQGPALLAVNDSIFNESDWKALQTIHGSNKTSDET